MLGLFLVFVLLASMTTFAQDSKIGFGFVGDLHTGDDRLLTSANSPLKWYYNWGPNPTNNLISSNALEFVPMIHGLDATQDPSSETAIKSSPQSSTHLLTFNELDGTTSSGGSQISPKDAATAYINYVLPFRNGTKGGRKWLISHPSTTGSPMGLSWLREFNTSCYEIDSHNGCPLDFIAVHWYGAFDGLTSWLGTMNQFYNTNTSRNPLLKLWVTELGFPQQSVQNTVSMMNQSLPYLDNLSYVERYAWFGDFRTNGISEWTGPNVAFFDNNGGLTQLGALYMGKSFHQGQQGQGNTASGLVANCLPMVVLCIVIHVLSNV